MITRTLKGETMDKQKFWTRIAEAHDHLARTEKMTPRNARRNAERSRQARELAAMFAAAKITGHS